MTKDQRREVEVEVEVEVEEEEVKVIDEEKIDKTLLLDIQQVMEKRWWFWVSLL